MTTSFWLPPLVRALTTAFLVTVASTIAEAFGPFWGALITSLPVSSGPAYVFLAMDHEPDFVAASALNSFAANAATGIFLTLYSVLARQRTHWRSLSMAVLGWLAAGLVVQLFTWGPVTALLLNLGVYGIGFVLLNRAPRIVVKVAPVLHRRLSDLVIRAIAVAAFVSLVVITSSMLGAGITGIIAVFPISLISLLAIVRPRIGGDATSMLAGSALRSMLGFGMMLLAFHLAIRPLGVPTALGIALLVSSSWSIGLLLFRTKTLIE